MCYLRTCTYLWHHFPDGSTPIDYWQSVVDNLQTLTEHDGSVLRTLRGCEGLLDGNPDETRRKKQSYAGSRLLVGELRYDGISNDDLKLLLSKGQFGRGKHTFVLTTVTFPVTITEECCLRLFRQQLQLNGPVLVAHKVKLQPGPHSHAIVVEGIDEHNNTQVIDSQYVWEPVHEQWNARGGRYVKPFSEFFSVWREVGRTEAEEEDDFPLQLFVILPVS